MSIEPVLKDALQLSVEERIRLVQDLWASIAEHPDAISVTDQQLAELRERLDGYRQGTAVGESWAKVRSRLGKRS